MINGVLRTYLRDTEAVRRPEAISHLPERLSVQYSTHRSVVNLWTKQFGATRAESMLAAGNTPSPLTVRVNTVRTTRDKLMDRLAQAGIGVEPSPYSDRLLLLKGKDILATEAYKEGLFTPQGIGSVMAVDALSPAPGETVIDVCAAPGGKSMAAAESMKNSGRIIAMDVYGNKLRQISHQAERLGLSIIETREHDATAADSALQGAADKVICDVPCSGLGVTRRKPEIKLRPLENAGRELAEKQSQILEASASYLKPGGLLLYSTCTVNHVENQAVTASFLERYPQLQMVEQRQLMPDGDEADGFYYCIIKN
jgi:16S rRNA (cytosine967-C5)-methyltransferase